MAKYPSISLDEILNGELGNGGDKHLYRKNVLVNDYCVAVLYSEQLLEKLHKNYFSYSWYNGQSLMDPNQANKNTVLYIYAKPYQLFVLQGDLAYENGTVYEFAI